MNIYKKQMNDLGLNIEEYSEIIKVPKSILKKFVNGNGEVVNNMEINNFLRNNLFSKHQEVENNKEEKKIEALNVKLMRGGNSYEAKKQWLLEKYPNSKEVKWYIYEYDKKIYFNKHDIKNRADLMRRYTFKCKEGRLKNQNQIGITTIERLTEKKYNQLGIHTAYPLICQLYDCLELGNIKESSGKEKKYYYSGNAQIGKRGFQEIDYSQEERKLKDWYNHFDFKAFCNRHNISSFEMGVDLDVSNSTVKQIKKGVYRPSMKMIYNLKNYVESKEKEEQKEENIEEPKIIVENKLISSPIEHKTEQEELLRNLLKDRLSEEEKILIKLFGGKI